MCMYMADATDSKVAKPVKTAKDDAVARRSCGVSCALKRLMIVCLTV